MKLYHFTDNPHFEAGKMAETGIRGGIVDWFVGRLPGQWLTADANPVEQKWTYGGLFDKRAVRICLDIPDDDLRLVKWDLFCAEHDVPDWAAEALNVTGSDDNGASWYVYLGDISADRIDAIATFTN